MNIQSNNTSFGQSYCINVSRNKEINPAWNRDYKMMRTDRKLYLTPREDDAELKKHALKMADMIFRSPETIEEKSHDIYEQLYNNELENALNIEV